MKVFSDLAHLQQLSESDPDALVRDYLERIVRVYSTDGHSIDQANFGFVALIEPGDVDRELPEIHSPKLEDVFWEGVTLEKGHFIAIYIGAGDYGEIHIIPDQPWVNGRLRQVLLDNISE